MEFCLIAAYLLSVVNVHLTAVSSVRNLEERTKWQSRQFKATNDCSNVKTLPVSIKKPGLALLAFQRLQRGYS